MAKSADGFWQLVEPPLHWNPALQMFLVGQKAKCSMNTRRRKQFKPFGVTSVIGVTMEYATKKIPKSLVGRIARLKARMSLDGRCKVTEGEVIALAICRLEEDMGRKQRLALSSLSGIVKGGKKGNAEEIDRIVYGV
jgi:hypothetical protein